MSLKPATRPDNVKEEVREEVRPKKTRLRKSNTDQLYVDPSIIPEGMDYQWVTDSILGQQTPQTRMGFEMNGWEAVPASRHAGMFMPKNYEGEINVGGLVLMERPLELTMEARAEDQSMARQARQAEEQRMLSGQLPGVTLDTQHASVKANTKVASQMGTLPVPD